MNLITNSISRLSSLYPLSRNETVLAAGIGVGLAMTSGVAIAGITIAATVALKCSTQALARCYLKSFSPTAEEIAKNYRKLEKLRIHILCQKITVASLNQERWENLWEEYHALKEENLSPHQKQALSLLCFEIHGLQYLRSSAQSRPSTWRSEIIEIETEEPWSPISEWNLDR